MAINQLIAAGIQPPRFESPYNMMAQFAQIQQAQQANALNQMRMQQMERQMAQEEALAGALRSGRPLTLEQALMGGERGLRALELQETFGERERKRKSAGQQLAAEALMETSPNLGDFAETYRRLKEQGVDMGPRAAELMLMPQEQRAREMQREVALTPGMGPVVAAREKSAAEVAKLIAERRRQEVEFQKLQMQMQGTLPAGPGAQTELTRLIAERDRLPPNDRDRAAYDARIEALGRGSGVTIETPVPVVDPLTGQVTYATRQEALGKTPPQFMEGLTSRERQNREAKLPAAKTAVTAFDAKSDKLASQIEELIAHPGLNQITGLLGGRIVGITNEGRRAEALYKSIVAQGGFSELQAMRDASTTGGALGNVSNQEGQYLRDAFAVLQRTQSTEDLQRGLRDALNTLRSAKARTREAFEDTYAYREGAAPTVAPSSRGSVGGEQPEAIDFRSLKR